MSTKGCRYGEVPAVTHLGIRFILHIVVFGNLHQVLFHQHLGRRLHTQLVDETFTDGGHLLLTTCLVIHKEHSPYTKGHKGH